MLSNIYQHTCCEWLGNNGCECCFTKIPDVGIVKRFMGGGDTADVGIGSEHCLSTREYGTLRNG